MKATKEPSDSFIKFNEFGNAQYSRLAAINITLAVVLAIPLFSFWYWIAGLVRSDFHVKLSFNASRVNNGINPEGLFQMLLLFFLLGLVHEFIHVLYLRFYISEWPKIVTGAWGTVHVEARGWYLPRNKLLAVNFAPFFILTFLGLVMLLIIPSNFLWMVAFGLVMNTALSIADIAGGFFFSLLPPRSYITTSGEVFIHESFLGMNSEGQRYVWKQEKIFRQIIKFLNLQLFRRSS
jgi:hypothetical protein